MRKLFLSLAIFCSLSSTALAQTTTTADITAPTEVGKSTMPPGQYLMTEVNTGKKYMLTVTDKGTMICGPAPAAATTAAATPATSPTSKTASGVKGMAEKGVEKYIQNKGMSQIQNFIK